MASLFRSDEGYSIDFTHNKRQRLRIGAATERQAQEFLLRLESLLQADKLGTPVSLEVAQWLVSIDARLHRKLVAIGLATQRLSTLGELLDAWLASLKPKTASGSPVVAIVGNLTEHFGRETRLRAIDDSSRRSFETYLARYATATISRRLRMAKQVFGFAMLHRSIVANPFEHVKTTGEVNKAKDFYVTEQIMVRLLTYCTDVELRVILCLVRYGGVRCPSEVMPMEWSQVHWDQDRFTVLSPKTAHHGHDRRTVPLFPTLRMAMTDLWEQCEPGTALTFPRLQGPHSRLTAKVTDLCRRAGIEPWPRVFDNMRASCITDWLRDLLPNGYSLMDLASWAGHSPQTMWKHYAMVSGEDKIGKAALHEART